MQAPPQQPPENLGAMSQAPEAQSPLPHGAGLDEARAANTESWRVTAVAWHLGQKTAPPEEETSSSNRCEHWLQVYS